MLDKRRVHQTAVYPVVCRFTACLSVVRKQESNCIMLPTKSQTARKFRTHCLFHCKSRDYSGILIKTISGKSEMDVLHPKPYLLHGSTLTNGEHRREV